MTSQNIKGIDQPPKLFGIRGKYLIIFAGVLSTVALLVLMAFVVFFISGNSVAALFLVIPWLVINGGVYALFRRLSDTTPFKGLKEPVHVVTHHKLKAFLK